MPRRAFTVVPFATGVNWWNDTPPVPAPEDRLWKLDLTPKHLLKSCPVCGVKLTPKTRRTHYCNKRQIVP